MRYQNQIMVFNNGNGRLGGNYSTVEIIDPPINGYNYSGSLPYLPSNTSWVYNYGNPNGLYAQNISGAQQLSNGNVLLCDGPGGKFIEVNSAGNTIWQYINPVSNADIMSQGTTPTQNIVFRCNFYPSNFSGFDNTALTTSTIIENSNTNANVCVLSAPLLIELLDFDCLKHDKQVDLVWSTTAEVNGSHFEIERSKNGYDFEKIGVVFCNRNSNSKIDYDFSDYEPLQQTSYYRLKQVDYDGKYEYSKIVNVTNDKIDNFKAFFSSQAGLIVIENSGLNKQDCPVHLYDAMGRLVKTTSFLAGVANTFIDTQTLYDGTYFLIIREVDKNTSFKLNINN